MALVSDGCTQVHVVTFGVVVDNSPRFPAHPSECPLWHSCTPLQSPRVTARRAVPSPGVKASPTAFASGLCKRERQPEALKQERAELERLNFELWRCWRATQYCACIATRVRTQVCAVRRHSFGQHHASPEVVFPSRRSVVLPAV